MTVSSVSVNVETDSNLPPAQPRGRSRTLFSRPNCTLKEIRKERRPSVPQIMATNPIYEGNSELYSYLPDSDELRSLENRGRSQTIANDAVAHELYFEIPPQVPLYYNDCTSS